MVGVAKIKGLDFSSLEEYFDYIVESKQNGQRKQAIELFNDLSDEQKHSFDLYINWLFGADAAFDIIAYLR